jgi:hypothetical protein
MSHNIPREWLNGFIARRAGLPSADLGAIIDAPVYEVFDSLDLVEVLGAVEAEFNVVLDPDGLRWDAQPTVGEFVEQLIETIGGRRSDTVRHD